MIHRIAMTGTAALAALCLSLGATPAAAAGAIVSTPVMGTYIYMTHRPSPGVAVDVAMSDCGAKYGGGCRVLASYGFGCLAIAQSRDGSHHSGWAVKPSPGQAQTYALGQCAKYGGPCSLDVVRCE